MTRRQVPLAVWLMLFSMVWICTPASSAQSLEDGVKGFQTHESFRYSISLLGLPAGTGTLQQSHPPVSNGHARVRLISTAKSNDFISLFFPVNNVVESTVDADTSLPEHFIFQRREGNRHEDFDVTFHHDVQHVTVIKDGEPSTITIPPGTHGPLSCLYYVRRLAKLEPGSSLFLTIHHDKKNYTVEAKIEGIETLSGPWGEVDAIRILGVMPFRGIFANEGNIRFWLTNDSKRVPLMMEARVIVGFVEAVLEGWKP